MNKIEYSKSEPYKINSGILKKLPPVYREVANILLEDGSWRIENSTDLKKYDEKSKEKLP
ncbi:hypothetical protein [Methanovulcanius yangii]|uniref:hypothetical protein n=1 Tax=Methanovulcanius yangii TaxID=1789227 RepID=UPI0029CA663B|nr:hypothetical protein [Methanovulcanius yangii]